MWIYLIGVIATIALMILGSYILKEDIYGNHILAIIFISVFSWVGFVSIIVATLVVSIIHLSENFRNRPVIKWKSQEKK